MEAGSEVTGVSLTAPLLCLASKAVSDGKADVSLVSRLAACSAGCFRGLPLPLYNKV